MKETFIKIGIILLIFCSTGKGCENYQIDDPNVFGTWQWLYTIGGFVGYTYPGEDQIYTLEFTEDSILIGRMNDIVDFATKYSKSFDTLTYSRGASVSYIIDITNGKLILTETQNGFLSAYKRINQ